MRISDWSSDVCSSDLAGRVQNLFNNLAFILAALLLMAPFRFVPFSNTLPALALLFLAAGLIQRDGVAVLLGYLANVCTIIYFGILIGAAGVAARELLHWLAASALDPPPDRTSSG